MGDNDKPQDQKPPLPTSDGLELDGRESRYIQTPNAKGRIGVFRYVAVTPGVLKTREGPKRARPEWIERHHKKGIGSPFVHVHEKQDLRAVVGKIRKSELTAAGACVREADIFDTQAGRDFAVVASEFPPGVSVKTKNGWKYGPDGIPEPDDNVSWVHDGAMMRGTQADPNAYGSMVEGIESQAGADALDIFGKPEGTTMGDNDKPQTPPASAPAPAPAGSAADSAGLQAALDAAKREGLELRKQNEDLAKFKKQVEAEADTRERKVLLDKSTQLAAKLKVPAPDPASDLASLRQKHTELLEGLEAQALGTQARPPAPAATKSAPPASGGLEAQGAPKQETVSAVPTEVSLRGGR